jgi:hypothetical protein
MLAKQEKIGAITKKGSIFSIIAQQEKNKWKQVYPFLAPASYIETNEMNHHTSSTSQKKEQ